VFKTKQEAQTPLPATQDGLQRGGCWGSWGSEEKKENKHIMRTLDIYKTMNDVLKK